MTMNTGTLIYLIVHDDLVCHGVQKSGLVDEVLLCILVLLLSSLLDIISSECVQTRHLVLLVVSVIEVSINACRLQKLDKILCLALFVVLQLKYSNSREISVLQKTLMKSSHTSLSLTASAIHMWSCVCSCLRILMTSSPSGSWSKSSSMT